MHTGVKHGEVLFAVAAVVVSLGILPYIEWSDTFCLGSSTATVGIFCETFRHKREGPWPMAWHFLV